jgi:hypothetical protein
MRHDLVVTADTERLGVRVAHTVRHSVTVVPPQGSCIATCAPSLPERTCSPTPDGIGCPANRCRWTSGSPSKPCCASWTSTTRTRAGRAGARPRRHRRPGRGSAHGRRDVIMGCWWLGWCCLAGGADQRVGEPVRVLLLCQPAGRRAFGPTCGLARAHMISPARRVSTRRATHLAKRYLFCSRAVPRGRECSRARCVLPGTFGSSHRGRHAHGQRPVSWRAAPRGLMVG